MKAIQKSIAMLGYTKVLFLILMILLVVSTLLPVPVNAQMQPDRERNLADLLSRLNEVTLTSRLATGFGIFLTSPTESGEISLSIQGIVEGAVTYRLSRIESSLFCVTPNTQPNDATLRTEECFDFTQIALILFNKTMERYLQEMPLPGEQAYPQTPGISGLLARFRQLNESTDNAPFAYTGFSLQFRHSIEGDNPDGLGMLVGVDYGGQNRGIARVGWISYQQDYVCIEVVEGSDGQGFVSFSCIPHSNIASVRLLRNYEIPSDPFNPPDISEFLAAQQGLSEPIGDQTTVELETLNTVSADLLTWWESDQTTLRLRLRVPIDDQGTMLTVSREKITGDATYLVTEVGESYLCLMNPDADVVQTIGELCTTFYNIAEATVVIR